MHIFPTTTRTNVPPGALRGPGTTDPITKRTNHCFGRVPTAQQDHVVIDLQAALDAANNAVDDPTNDCFGQIITTHGAGGPWTPKALAAAAQEQRTHWSTLYLAQSPEGAIFRARIDAYRAARAELVQDIQADIGGLQKEEILARANALGTQLAIAFGLADANGWTAETKAGCLTAGNAYALPSIKSNWLNQAPGIARSVSNLATHFVDGVTAAAHSAITNPWTQGFGIACSLTQIALTGLGPIWGAAAQSSAVAQQALDGPKFLPNVVSSKQVGEDGKPVPLRTVRELKPARKALARLMASLDKEIAGKKDAGTTRARARGMADKADAKAAKHERKGKPEPSLRLHAATLRQAEGALDVEDPKVELESVMRKGEAPLAFAQAYEQLNVMPSQSRNRAIRNTLNLTLAGAAAGITVARLTDWNGSDWDSVAIDASLLALQVAQGAIYQWRQGSAAGEDYLRKMGTQFQIIAMTGTGNLDIGGQFNPARLDDMIKSSTATRLDHLAAVLNYDNQVYVAALIGYLTRADGELYQRGVVVNVAGQPSQVVNRTYEDLRAGYLAAKGKGADWIRDAARNLGLKADDMESINVILGHIERNEKAMTLLKAGKVEPLLDASSDQALLTPRTRQMLEGALRCAVDPNPGQVDLAHNEALARAKGSVEKYSSTAAANQAAQKLGQAMSYVIAGSGSPNLIKAAANLVSDISELAGNKSVGRFAKVGGGAISIAGSMLAICLGFAYHKFIAEKNRHRARDELEKRTSLPNSGLVAMSDHDFFSFINRSFGKEITDFSTLASEPISHLLPPGHRIDAERSTTLWEDFKDQMFATDLGVRDRSVSTLGRMAGFFTARYGSLDGQTLESLEAKNHELLREIQQQLDATRLAVTPEQLVEACRQLELVVVDIIKDQDSGINRVGLRSLIELLTHLTDAEAPDVQGQPFDSALQSLIDTANDQNDDTFLARMRDRPKPTLKLLQGIAADIALYAKVRWERRGTQEQRALQQTLGWISGVPGDDGPDVLPSTTPDTSSASSGLMESTLNMPSSLGNPSVGESIRGGAMAWLSPTDAQEARNGLDRIGKDAMRSGYVSQGDLALMNAFMKFLPDMDVGEDFSATVNRFEDSPAGPRVAQHMDLTLGSKLKSIADSLLQYLENTPGAPVLPALEDTLKRLRKA